MAFNNTINIPFTITGGVSTGAGNPYYSAIDTLSGYTNALTRFIYSVSANDEYLRSPGISNDNFVWDMGDGTTIKGPSAIYIYSTPGVYTVSLIAYSSGGNAYLSTATKQLSVSDFINDDLILNTTDVIDTINVPAGTKGVVSIKVNRHNSWQTYDTTKSDGYTLSLYASGSESNSLNLKTYKTEKWQHVGQTWSFYEKVTADNFTTSLTPVDSIKTTSEKLYYIPEINRGGLTYTRVPSSVLTTVSGVSTVFVGTTGSSEFYYADDTPKYSTDPVFVFASLDTSKFPDHLKPLSYDLNETGKNFFQKSKLVIPIRVRFNSANNIIFTSPGITDILISKNKWQGTEIPFFINLEDQYNQITENYPPLRVFNNPLSAKANNDRVVVPGTIGSTETYVTSLSLLSSNSTSSKLLSAHFFKETDGQLSSSLTGMFRGYMVPLDVGDDLTLTGSLSVNDIPNVYKDVLFGWLMDNENSKLHRLFFTQHYMINDISGELTSKNDVRVITVDPFGSTTDNRARKPICTHPVIDNINDNRVQSIVADADRIFIYDTYSTNISAEALSSKPLDRRSFDLSVIEYDNIINQLVSSKISTTSNQAYVLNPTSISVDSGRNFWLGLSGGSSVVRVDSVSGVIDRLIGYHDANKGYNPVNVNYGVGITILDSIGGDDESSGTAPNTNNLIEPGIVETDKLDGVWVGYTNPISGYIEKYNSDGIAQNIKYSFNQGYVPSDMVVDCNDNLWVATTDHFKSLSGYAFELPELHGPWLGSGPGKTHTTSGTVTAERLGDNFRYRTASNSISNFEAGHIVEITGFTGSSSLLNGMFVIESVSASSRHFSVRPYIGNSNQIIGDEHSGTVALKIRPSDKVYRFNNAGSKSVEVSGLLAPTLIVPDLNQNLWVAHNVNTLTQVSTGGEILDTIYVQSDDFVSNYLSAGSYLTSLSTISAQSHIGALSVDSYNRLIVVNSFENKVFTIPITTRSLSSVHALPTQVSPTSGHTGFIYGRKSAFGDWTGYRWMNKYKNTTGMRIISGETTLTVLPSGGKYKIAKWNEDFDPAETLKSYAQQPFLVDKQVLFDDFLGTIVGTISSEPTVLGRQIYEKIGNFVSNMSDVDECNIPALYSMCQQYGIDVNNYDFTYPGGLNRVMNILSISHNRLWGQRSRYNRDFRDWGTGNPNYAVNLGTELDILTATVVAGTPLVAKQLFNKEFRLIRPMYVPGAVSNPGYQSSVGYLSSYPLSAYVPHWHWGLHNGVSGTDIAKHYNFYEWTDTFSDIQLEGVIDWENPATTISESQSGIEFWLNDNSVVDTMLDYEIRKGLGLFTDSLSASTSGLQ